MSEQMIFRIGRIELAYYPFGWIVSVYRESTNPSFKVFESVYYDWWLEALWHNRNLIIRALEYPWRLSDANAKNNRLTRAKTL